MSTAIQHVRSSSLRSRSRSAFTMTEILVVIVIISILAGLGASAVMNALWYAKQTRIKVEVDQIDAAMKAFREKFGAYPPMNMTDPANNLPLRQFVASAFPRYNLSNLANDLQNGGAPTTAINPAQSLVFWLKGFSPDVTQPFIGAGERVPFYNFEKTRLYPVKGFNDGNNNGTQDSGEAFLPQSYLAPGGSNTAFLYYDHRSYSDNASNPADVEQPREVKVYSPIDNSDQGYAVPYVLEVDNNKIPDEPDTYANPDSFQIIAAGQDGFFGSTDQTKGAKPRLYPIGLNYDEADGDNVTNFCETNNLNDKRP